MSSVLYVPMTKEHLLRLLPKAGYPAGDFPPAATDLLSFPYWCDQASPVQPFHCTMPAQFLLGEGGNGGTFDVTVVRVVVGINQWVGTDCEWCTVDLLFSESGLLRNAAMLLGINSQLFAHPIPTDSVPTTADGLRSFLAAKVEECRTFCSVRTNASTAAVSPLWVRQQGDWDFNPRPNGGICRVGSEEPIDLNTRPD
jgi:hypothetical protein